MSKHITLEIEDELLRQAEMISRQSDIPVEEVFISWLHRGASELPVELMSDEEILQLATGYLPPHEQEELSDLLADQREQQLDLQGNLRLDFLMSQYRQSWIRKAQAMNIAVSRGLLQALES